MENEVVTSADQMDLTQFVSRAKNIRQLSEADDGEILNFFDKVGMKAGGFQILLKRHPHFYDLLRHRGGKSFIFGLRDTTKALVGTGAMTSTPAYIGGKLGHSIYLCDLRVECPDREVQKEWKIFLGNGLKNASRLKEVGERGHLLSVIMETNERARKALEEKSFEGQRLLNISSYAMVMMWKKKPFKGTRKTPEFRVENNPGLEELESFLEGVHRKQAFGYVFGAPHFELRRRLKEWKNLSLKDFYVVRDAQNKIVASTALWNPNHCKQVVIEGPWWTRIVNPVMNLLSLPEFGKPLEVVYLTNLTFSWDLSSTQKESAFAVMSDALWLEKKKRKAHCLAFCDFNDHSLMGAMQNYIVSRTKVRMYISLPEEQVANFNPQTLGQFPPAFEMALV